MLDELSAPRDLVLPPPFTAHWLARGDVMTHASVLAPDHGAGTFVWHASSGHGGAGRLDFAVVLEPDLPLGQARKAVIVGMLALGDAVVAHCPPERAVGFGWPGELRLDACRIGGLRLSVAPGADETDVPDWMVLGVELIADRDHLAAPGLMPDSVSLKEEDFADPPAVLESFAAYLMLGFDRLAHGGFEPLAMRYASQLINGGTLTQDGNLVGPDGLGLLRDAVATAPWRDDTGPKL